MKKFINIILYSGLIICTVILLGFMNSKHKEVKISSVTIQIYCPDEHKLIDKDYIIQHTDYIIDSMENKTITEIDLNKLEKQLEESCFIENANVYTTINGKVILKIFQRIPLVRIFDNDGNSFYIDNKKCLFKTSNYMAAKVPIANGYIGKIESINNVIVIDSLQNPAITDIYRIAKYINNNELLRSQIDQIYITENHEFELYPKIGKHYIELGKANNLEEKVEKLVIFYKKGLGNKNWNKYKKINLKFNNQVVCTKK